MTPEVKKEWEGKKDRVLKALRVWILAKGDFAEQANKEEVLIERSQDLVKFESRYEIKP